jgi:hypothetical protein
MIGHREEFHYPKTLLAADEPGRSIVRAMAKELPHGKPF